MRLLLIALLFPIIIIGGCIVGNFLSMFLEPIQLISSKCNECDVDVMHDEHSPSIYIPGAGFSGFFYTLGRLQVLADMNLSLSYDYYCFSAGCLALMTHILDVSIQQVVELAHSSRNRYISGEISRYNVVENFVNGLLDDNNAVHNNVSTTRPIETEYENATPYDERLQRLQNLLPRINVITSTWDKQSFISQRQEKPTSVEHLQRMLLETTYIPFITGDSLGLRLQDEDGSFFRYHNDGAFAGLLQSLLITTEIFNPSKYRHSLLLPWRFDILINGLNLFALDHAKAIHYWEEGMRRGV